MPRVLLISGSPVEPSKVSALLGFADRTLQAAGIATATAGVAHFPAEDLMRANYNSAVFDDFKAQLADARAVVIGTPIYKASIPGALKALLDILPQNALRDKTVVPIATAGTIAHLLAIDYSLKPVLAVLGATDLRQGVYIVDSAFRFTPDGFALDPDLQQRLDQSLAHLARTVLASPA